MKLALFAVFGLIAYSGLSFAGGSIGGGGGAIADLESVLGPADVVFNAETLPKIYIDGDDFRRVKARLSVAGVHAVPAVVGPETVDLKLFRESVVDLNFSREVLPSE